MPYLPRWKHFFASCCILSSLQPVSAFVSLGPSLDGWSMTSVGLGAASSSSSAKDLLYQDQQKAMLRRSIQEEELLKRSSFSELKAPKLKATVQSGTGFGSPMTDESAQSADKLKAYVLEQQSLAREETEADPSLSRSFYGVEQARVHRCDLELSLLRGGYAVDKKSAEPVEVTSTHVLADVLQKLLGKKGSLKAIYEKLVTLKGEFYELGAVVTDPGSDRQIVHPDLPFKPNAPLYVIFLALQDVDEAMGPTSFLLGTQTAKENAKFNDPQQKDEQLSSADCQLCTLKKGDAVLFDARVLHCGNANDPINGKTRALFNFSFRNPKVSGNLGYDGSIRPGYCQAMNLGDVCEVLENYKNGDPDPFAKYGSGLLA